MRYMIARAQAALGRVQPVTMTLGRLLYHPEAIAVGLSPSEALDPVIRAAQAATRDAGGTGETAGSKWPPHLTLCYSTAEQAAAPVIAELGKSLPACTVTIRSLSLPDGVHVRGPARGADPLDRVHAFPGPGRGSVRGFRVGRKSW
jgi:hypothetical protein